MTAAKAAPTNLTYQPERAHLVCQMGGSDKVYDVQLSQSENGWSVDCWNGPRGGTLTHRPQKQNVDYAEAKTEFDKIIAAKCRGKGDGTHYTDTRESAAAPASQASTNQAAKIPAPPAFVPGAPLSNCRGAVSTTVEFSPELLTRIDQDQAEQFVNDPRYLFQNKEDADRLTVCARDREIYGFNKLGLRVNLDGQLHQAIARLCALTGITRLLIDGEWTPTGHVAWDMLEMQSSLGPDPDAYDLREYRYADRLALLEVLLDAPQHGRAPDVAALLRVIESARTPEAKRALLTRRYDGDTKVREGICVKNLDAPYRLGRNGQHKKFKFEQTASFLVGPKPGAKARDGHRSIALYIVDPASREHADWLTVPSAVPNRIRFVATAKVAERYAVPPVGSIVDARYVAAYRLTGGIEQPNLSWEGHDLKVRTDVRPEECSTAQLKYKTAAEGTVRP